MKQVSWWLALIRARGQSLRERHALLERHTDPEIVFSHERGLEEPDWLLIERDLEWLDGEDHHLVTFQDSTYPSLLRDIADPPLALFVVGDPAVLASPSLAIVGSRNPTNTGTENAEAFAAFLASCGLVIVSGLALGVDAAAHRGALTGGRTVAVLGTGPDRMYPARNRVLAREIARNGAMVSEFPPGTGVRPEHFPQRNRIISGLAVGTLVVEAALKSGSLVTARFAAEQGREVFAIPGSIHNPLAKGCHQLIRQGAKLVDSAEHVLEEIGSLVATTLTLQRADASHASGDDALDEDYRRLLDVMDDTPLPVDRLVARSGLTPAGVSSMLLIMELRGMIHSAPGGGYAKGPKRS